MPSNYTRQFAIIKLMVKTTQFVPLNLVNLISNMYTELLPVYIFELNSFCTCLTTHKCSTHHGNMCNFKITKLRTNKIAQLNRTSNQNARIMSLNLEALGTCTSLILDNFALKTSKRVSFKASVALLAKSIEDLLLFTNGWYHS